MNDNQREETLSPQAMSFLKEYTKTSPINSEDIAALRRGNFGSELGIELLRAAGVFL